MSLEVYTVVKHLIDQPSKVPTRKVSATALAGSIVTILVAVGGIWNFEPEPELVAAVTTLISFVAGYVIKDRA